MQENIALKCNIFGLMGTTRAIHFRKLFSRENFNL